MPQSIYDFDDYRIYLSNRLEELKKLHPNRPRGYFAELCGFSNAYLSMILKGKRNLTDPMIERFVEFLDLKSDEAKYFRLLCKLNQAEATEDRIILARQILSLRGFRKHNPLAAIQYRYFSKWYYAAIFEQICAGTKHLQPEDFQDLFLEPLQADQVRQALEDLEQLSLVKKRADGTWMPTQMAVVTPDTVYSPFLIQFHKQMLTLAQKHIFEIDETEREISGLTFSIRKSQVNKIKEIVRRFHQEMFTALENEKPGELIYQMSFALFPINKKNAQEE